MGGNMLRFLTLAALAISAYSDMGAMKKMHKDMMVFNSQSACWGKGNMIYFQVALGGHGELYAREPLWPPEARQPHPRSVEPERQHPPLPRQQQPPFQSLPAPAPSKNPFKSSNLNL